MSVAEAVLLVLAGIGGGLCGSVAGLASLASYPALLAFGLPPVTANVTNTVALVFSSAGSITGSRPELLGQARRVRPLAIAGTTGGALGGLLLLVTPRDAFEQVVPILIALAAGAILVRRRLVITAVADHPHDSAAATAHDRPSRGSVVAIGLIGIYGGYFGAGAGVMLLALLLFVTSESMARCNAIKNVVLGLANGIAAVAFVFFGPVRWIVVAPLGAGLFIGGRLGPAIVRRVPATPLRIVIALAGLGLAVKLGFDAYT